MDLSGGMPTKAWIEIRNVRGDLQERIAAHIEGGTVSAECPAFPPGRHGWIQVCVQHGDEPPWREEPRIESLPAEPCLLVFQMDAVEVRDVLRRRSRRDATGRGPLDPCAKRTRRVYSRRKGTC